LQEEIDKWGPDTSFAGTSVTKTVDPHLEAPACTVIDIQSTGVVDWEFLQGKYFHPYPLPPLPSKKLHTYTLHGGRAPDPGPVPALVHVRYMYVRICMYMYVYVYISGKSQPFSAGVFSLRGIHFQDLHFGECENPICVLGVWSCILGVWTCILGAWTCILVF
jgi:hypothetical protein